ncbi:hypothetical protein F2P81_013278 [Scophthalmus maximus]|uniref:Uncharacterized protein n=1 Tax=Scophthalmus maximus TaxID=52904 RepID=A0A6A4SUG0_SCOMX|nr:hypothetical protein F2P81_013278 [Scophthalmus maximus]
MYTCSSYIHGESFSLPNTCTNNALSVSQHLARLAQPAAQRTGMHPSISVEPVHRHSRSQRGQINQNLQGDTHQTHLDSPQGLPTSVGIHLSVLSRTEAPQHVCDLPNPSTTSRSHSSSDQGRRAENTKGCEDMTHTLFVEQPQSKSPPLEQFGRKQMKYSDQKTSDSVLPVSPSLLSKQRRYFTGFTAQTTERSRIEGNAAPDPGLSSVPLRSHVSVTVADDDSVPFVDCI